MAVIGAISILLIGIMLLLFAGDGDGSRGYTSYWYEVMGGSGCVFFLGGLCMVGIGAYMLFKIITELGVY